MHSRSETVMSAITFLYIIIVVGFALFLVSYFCPLSDISDISFIFAVSESSLSHTDMWLSLDRLCSVVKMTRRTYVDTCPQIHRHGNIWTSAVHVVIVLWRGFRHCCQDELQCVCFMLSYVLVIEQAIYKYGKDLIVQAVSFLLD